MTRNAWFLLAVYLVGWFVLVRYAIDWFIALVAPKAPPPSPAIALFLKLAVTTVLLYLLYHLVW